MSKSTAVVALVLMMAVGAPIVWQVDQNIQAEKIATAPTLQDPIPVMMNDARSAYVLVVTEGPLPAYGEMTPDRSSLSIRHDVRVAVIAGQLEGANTATFESEIKRTLTTQGYPVKSVHWYWERVTIDADGIRGIK